MEHPKNILNQLGIRPRKKWGQNFLMYENNVKSIVAFANIAAGSNVIEIGPGLGAMSEVLIASANKYIGIEYDPILFQFLCDTYSGSHAQFVHQDVLDFDFEAVLSDEPYIVMGNLPYHITTPILEMLTHHQHRITKMTFLLQKEVVDRICASANSKTYGRMSVWLQSKYTIEKGPVLKPSCFMPAPDVDSQVITLTPKSSHHTEAFFEFVKSLFQKRRKTIQHIINSLDYDLSKVNPNFLQKRPENLTIEDFEILFNSVND